MTDKVPTIHETRDLLFYQTEDGLTLVEVRFEDGSEREILTHAGRITHEDAITRANAEFDKFKQRQIKEKSAVEVHFEKSLKKLEQIESKVSKVKPLKKKKGDV